MKKVVRLNFVSRYVRGAKRRKTAVSRALRSASNLFVDFQRFLYAFSVVKTNMATSSERNHDVSAKEPSSCPAPEARRRDVGARFRPSRARTHRRDRPTARVERAGPRDPSRRARKRRVGSHDEKAALALLTTREMTDRVLLLERAYQGRAMFVKVSCKAGESPVELSHHPELRFRFIPRPHDGAPLIANAVQFEVRLARTRAFSKLSRSCFFSLKKKKRERRSRRVDEPPRTAPTTDPRSARARLFHTRAPLVSFTARVVHHRRAMRLS